MISPEGLSDLTVFNVSSLSICVALQQLTHSPHSSGPIMNLNHFILRSNQDRSVSQSQNHFEKHPNLLWGYAIFLLNFQEFSLSPPRPTETFEAGFNSNKAIPQFCNSLKDGTIQTTFIFSPNTME